MFEIAGGILLAIVFIFVVFFVVINVDVFKAIFGIIAAAAVIGWFVIQIL